MGKKKSRARELEPTVNPARESMEAPAELLDSRSEAAGRIRAAAVGLADAEELLRDHDVVVNKTLTQEANDEHLVRLVDTFPELRREVLTRGGELLRERVTYLRGSLASSLLGAGYPR